MGMISSGSQKESSGIGVFSSNKIHFLQTLPVLSPARQIQGVSQGRDIHTTPNEGN